MIDIFNNFFNKEKAKTLTINDLKRKNFEAIDFYFSDTARQMKIDNTPPIELLPNGMLLADALQELRDAINLPIIIVNGYRSSQINKLVGGSPTSKHMQFLACDIKIPNLSIWQIAKKIYECKIKTHIVLIEPVNNCVHYEIHPDKTKYQNVYKIAKKINGEWHSEIIDPKTLI